MTEAEFLTVRWPEEFVVSYTGGESERLLRGDGVDYLLAADDPGGLGGFSASIPPKGRGGHSPGQRLVRPGDIAQIRDMSGRILWQPSLDTRRT